jgi:hypothetical protein
MNHILIKHHIKNLRLRPDASFPSQVSTARELILAWRREQRLKLVGSPGRALNANTPP